MKKLLILLSSSLTIVGTTAGTALTVVSCTNGKKDQNLTKSEVEKEIQAALSKSYKTKALAKDEIWKIKSQKFTIKEIIDKNTSETEGIFDVVVEAKKGYKLNFDGKISINVKIDKNTIEDDKSVVKKFKNLQAHNLIVDVDLENKPAVPEPTQDSSDQASAVSNKLRSLTGADNQVQKEKIIEQLYNLLKIDSTAYKLEIVEGSEFLSPNLVKNEENVINSSSTVNLGKVSVKIIKVADGSELTKEVFNWNTKAYDYILQLVKAFDVQNTSKELDIILGSIPMFGNLTAGSLYSMIGLVSGLVDTILGEETMDQLNNQLDVKKLSQLDPKIEEGKKAYDDFQKNFINFFENILKQVSGLLQTVAGIDSFEIKGQKIKIAELLDVNLFDLLGLKKEPIVFEKEIKNPALNAKINMQADIKSQSGEYGIKLRDLLSNIAPDVVNFIKFILDEKSFSESKNVMFELIKYLLKPINKDLGDINNKNFDEQTKGGTEATEENNGTGGTEGTESHNYNKANTNLDSIFYNFLSGFDRNKRNANGNFSIKLNASVEAKVFFFTASIKIKDKYIGDLLKWIHIDPSSSVLNVVNKFLKYDKNKNPGIDLTNKTTNIFSDLNLIKDIDTAGLKKEGVQIDTLAEFVLNPSLINPLIGSMVLPTVTPNEITKLFSKEFLARLIGKEISQEVSSYEVEKGYLIVEFFDNETKEWVSLDQGISSFSELEKYGNMRLMFKNLQFSGTYTSVGGEEHKFLTNDNISFEVKLSGSDQTSDEPSDELENFN